MVPRNTNYTQGEKCGHRCGMSHLLMCAYVCMHVCRTISGNTRPTRVFWSSLVDTCCEAHKRRGEVDILCKGCKAMERGARGRRMGEVGERQEKRNTGKEHREGTKIV